MFAKTELDAFQRDGFFTVPHFFDPAEVRLLQSEIDRLKRDGKLRNVATDGDGATTSKTRKNLQLCPVNPFSEPFKALPFSQKVVNAVSQLIGDPVRLRLDQVFLKPAKDGAGTNWHQDNAYFRVAEPLRGVAMWIAVHDATVANGTMHMAPGMHHLELEHRRDPDSDHHIRCWPDETNETACELEAGGVVFFCYGTPHCTKGNGSDRDRAGLAYHFYNSNFPPNDGATGGMPFLTLSAAQGGTVEYGADQRGLWDQFVNSV